MSKERWVFVSLAAVAGTGLMVDRFILSPEDASAAVPASEDGLISGSLAGVTGSVGDTIKSTLKETLAGVVEDELAAEAGSLEFGPAAEWIKAPTIAEVSDDPGTRTPRAAEQRPPSGMATEHPLTLVMPTSSGGIAVIGGVRMRVGETHPSGFRLISVSDRTATVEKNGKQIVLTMRFSAG